MPSDIWTDYEELPLARCESIVSQSSGSARPSIQSQCGEPQLSQEPGPSISQRSSSISSSTIPPQTYNPSRESAEFAAFATYSCDNFLTHIQRIIGLYVQAIQRDVPDIIRDAQASMLSEFRRSRQYSSCFSQAYNPRSSLHQVDEHVRLGSPPTEILPYYDPPPQGPDMQMPSFTEMRASSLRAVSENMPGAS